MFLCIVNETLCCFFHLHILCYPLLLALVFAILFCLLNFIITVSLQNLYLPNIASVNICVVKYIFSSINIF